VENDGSNCLVEAVGQMDYRMHSGEVLHHMRRPVLKRTLVVAVVELLGTGGTGSASQDCGVYQHPRKPGQPGFVKPWTKVAVL
jgi:hypothetical protein